MARLPRLTCRQRAASRFSESVVVGARLFGDQAAIDELVKVLVEVTLSDRLAVVVVEFRLQRGRLPGVLVGEYPQEVTLKGGTVCEAIGCTLCAHASPSAQSRQTGTPRSASKPSARAGQSVQVPSVFSFGSSVVSQGLNPAVAIISMVL